MIASLTMVQAEADIIEYCVRVNLRFVDHMFIVLNPSHDGTGEILDELVREGLPITVFRTARNHYAQSVMASWFANRIRDQFYPDYLCFLDADEIILAKDRAAFAEALETVPANHVGAISWRTFLPPENINDYGFDPDGWSRVPAREKHFVKVVIPGSTSNGADVVLTNGQHAARSSDGVLPLAVLDHVLLGHFPVRSIEQITSKTLAGILNRTAATGTKWIERGMSYQRQTVLEYLESAENPDIRVIAANYTSRLWNVDVTRAPTATFQAPRCELWYRSLIVRRQPQFDLFWRAQSSMIAAPDPTEILLERMYECHAADAQGSHNRVLPQRRTISHACDWPPFEYVWRRFKPSAVHQVGCGYGTYLALFRASGVEVRGTDCVEHTRWHHLASNEYRRMSFDAEQALKKSLCSVSIFIDFAEHLPPSAAFSLIGDLCAETSDAIVFSSASPIGSGRESGTSEESACWLDAFAAHHWYVDIVGTISMRMNATLHHFRRKLFLLTKKAPPEPAALSRLLRQSYHEQHGLSSVWPHHLPSDSIIGSLGDSPAFSMDGSRQTARLPCCRPKSDRQR